MVWLCLFHHKSSIYTHFGVPPFMERPSIDKSTHSISKPALQGPGACDIASGPVRTEWTLPETASDDGGSNGTELNHDWVSIHGGTPKWMICKGKSYYIKWRFKLFHSFAEHVNLRKHQRNTTATSWIPDMSLKTVINRNWVSMNRAPSTSVSPGLTSAQAQCRCLKSDLTLPLAIDGFNLRIMGKPSMTQGDTPIITHYITLYLLRAYLPTTTKKGLLTV